MSTFYVLPPRPVFGDHLAAFLQAFLPGLDWDAAARAGLADAVADVAVSETDAYLILPRRSARRRAPSPQALTTVSGRRRTTKWSRCGIGGRAGEPAASRWRLGDRLPPSAAAA